MDGCDGAGDGHELVVGGDGMIADGGEGRRPGRPRCAPRRRWASASGGALGGTPEPGARGRAAELAAQHLGGVAPATGRARGAGRPRPPARTRRSPRAGPRATGRPRRIARHSGVDARRPCRAGGRLGATPSETRSYRVLSPPPAGMRRVDEADGRAAPGASSAAASTALSGLVEQLVGAKAAPPTATTVAVALVGDDDEGESRLPRHDERPAPCRSAAAAPPSTVPTPSRAATVQMPRSSVLGLERVARRAPVGANDEPGVGDDQRAAAPTQSSTSSRCSSSRPSTRTSATSSPSSGRPTDSSTSAPSALEQRDERARAQRRRPSEGRAAARRPAPPPSEGDREQARRRRTPATTAPRADGATQPRRPDGEDLLVERREPRRLRGAGGGTAVPGRLEQLGGGRQRRRRVGEAHATSAHVLARRATGLLGDDAAPHEVGDQRPVAAAQRPRPSGPPPRGARPRPATRRPSG